MRGAEAWAARLAEGGPIAERVAIVVAHPDDESLWTGSLLARASDAVLIHLTDGAPLDMQDAARLGFTSRKDYARAREAEIVAALDALGAAPARKRFDIVDKTAAERLPALARALRENLEGAALVVTHPYEGGHPDHDAAAWGVARACGSLGDLAPAHLEFACYHRAEDGARLFGRFPPGPAEHGRMLPIAERARVAGAIAAHRTQAVVIGGWTPEREAWRAAPEYDFSAPPPPGRALYDEFGWEITSARFSALAATADAEFAAC